MDHPHYQQDSETFDQVNAPKSHRSQLELEQLARDIVEDRELLACVLNAAAQLLGSMAPEERRPVEESDRARSSPPVSQPRTDSRTPQPYHHSPDPSSRYNHPPQFPPYEKENMTEEAMEQPTVAHETSGQTTPRQPTWGPPTICRSPSEDSSTVLPTASETATGQPTPEQPMSEKPTTGQPTSRQPIPGPPRSRQPIPGPFTPDQPTTVPFSHAQPTTGQYATYQPMPGQWTRYQPTHGQWTPYPPRLGQYTTYQGPPGQYPVGYPTPNQYHTSSPPRNQQPRNQPPPARETKEERDARNLAEYIAHGYDEEMKEEHPEHYMRRRSGDGKWELRKD